MRLLSLKHSAERMDVSRSVVFRWVDQGLIPITILGMGPKGNRIVRIDEADLEKFMRERKNAVKTRQSHGASIGAGRFKGD
jgi:predicted site-specific integrase-resolvase